MSPNAHGKPPYPMPDPQPEPELPSMGGLWFFLLLIGAIIAVTVSCAALQYWSASRGCAGKSCEIGRPHWTDGECLCAIPAKEKP